MRLPALIAAITTVTLVPLAALAATYYVPSEVFALIQQSSQPMDTTVEMHMHTENTFYASLWMTGESQNGNKPDGRQNMKATLDLSDGKETLRIHATARIAGAKAYAIIDSVEGNYDEELATMAAALKDKKWIEFDIPQEAFTSSSASVSANAAFSDMVNALLSLQATNTQKGSSYSLSFRSPAELDKVLQRTTAPSQTEYLSVILQMLKDATVHMKVDTAKDGSLQSVKFYVAQAANGVDVVVQSVSTVRTRPVTVTIPTDTVPFAAVAPMLGRAFALPSVLQPTADEVPPPVLNEVPSATSEQTCTGTTAKDIARIRRGECSSLRYR
ncbi:MAG: hypothetical protein JWM56_17 [Candidatus Peribacteria bacterium]|nr:hypothetical protein [Candidatus Peribacteria bacterium]